LLDTPFKNDYIVGNVLIGGEGPFTVAFSTGQTRLWVLGSDVKNIHGARKSYDPK
jgi:hypothetical protein